METVSPSPTKSHESCRMQPRSGSPEITRHLHHNKEKTKNWKLLRTSMTNMTDCSSCCGLANASAAGEQAQGASGFRTSDSWYLNLDNPPKNAICTALIKCNTKLLQCAYHCLLWSLLHWNLLFIMFLWQQENGWISAIEGEEAEWANRYHMMILTCASLLTNQGWMNPSEWERDRADRGCTCCKEKLCCNWSFGPQDNTDSVSWRVKNFSFHPIPLWRPYLAMPGSTGCKGMFSDVPVSQT